MKTNKLDEVFVVETETGGRTDIEKLSNRYRIDIKVSDHHSRRRVNDLLEKQKIL